MTHEAKILADSISPDGVRLTTFEITFPRIVLAEFNTHRTFSRNSASSRAIPVKKMLKRVEENPYIPSTWGKNQRGMRALEEVDEETAALAKDAWLRARDDMVAQVRGLLELGIHKQLTNRLLEPWMWHTVIVTATEWSNFYNLRNNPEAHPAIQVVAWLMQELYDAKKPKPIGCDEWHLPLIMPEDSDWLDPLRGQQKYWDTAVKISCARCARVSYLTHDGKRDLEKDLELYDMLLQSGHMSPFEHTARPASFTDLPDSSWKWSATEGEAKEAAAKHFFGNFKGWVQHRKLIPGEADILAHRKGT